MQETKAEEERFSETLARGLERFEELAGQPAISAEDAFMLAATYGFPIEPRSSWPKSAASRWTSTATGSSWTSTVLSRIRRRGGACDRTPRTEFVGYEKTEVLTAIAALEPDGRPLPREAPRVAVLRGGWRTGLGRRASSSTRRRAHGAELVGAVRAGDDQTLLFK